jgi:hypothetical protein
MLEIEQASITTEAQLRLEHMRGQMGLPAGDQAGAPALSAAPQQAVAAQPAPALSTGAVTTPADAEVQVTDAEEVAEPAGPADA